MVWKATSMLFSLSPVFWVWLCPQPGASQMAQMVKNAPAMQETWVQSPGGEDPLKKGMATHSSILTWRIPWTEEPGRLQSMGSQTVEHNFQIRKGVRQGCILSPCLFNFYAEYIRRNARLDETQAEIKIAREISIISDMHMTPHLRQKEN